MSKNSVLEFVQVFRSHPAPRGHTSGVNDPSNRLATVHQRYRQADRQDNGPVGYGELLLVTVAPNSADMLLSL